MATTSSRPLYRDRNLHVIFAITLMAVLGVASISPAFPAMTRHFRVTPQQIGLLITVFTLPGVLLTPVLGVLADRFGRKRILVPSLLLFGIAGGICALVRQFHWLLMARVAQGMGAAALGSLNVTLIGDLFPPKQRSTAMGYNGSVLSVGTAAYPAIGGALAMFGYYYPFLLALAAVPIGIWAMVALPEPTVGRRAALGTYLRQVRRGVLRREVLGLFFTSTAAFVCLYGSYLAFLPFLLERRFLAAANVIGLVFSASSVATALTSWQLGRLTRLTSERALIVVGLLLQSVALTAFTFADSTTQILVMMPLYGAGTGIALPAVTSLLASLAPVENRAAFMSLNGTVLRLGQTLGPISMGAVYGVWGLEAAFYAGSVVLVVAALVVAWLVRPPRRPADAHR